MIKRTAAVLTAATGAFALGAGPALADGDSHYPQAGWAANGQSEVTGPTSLKLQDHEDGNTSVETSSLNLNVSEGAEISAEYTLSEEASCESGEPRIFAYTNGTMDKSMLCSADGDEADSGTLTFTTSSAGMVDSLGLVYSRDSGHVTMENLTVDGTSVLFQEPSDPDPSPDPSPTDDPTGDPTGGGDDSNGDDNSGGSEDDESTGDPTDGSSSGDESNDEDESDSWTEWIDEQDTAPDGVEAGQFCSENDLYSIYAHTENSVIQCQPDGENNRWTDAISAPDHLMDGPGSDESSEEVEIDPVSNEEESNTGGNLPVTGASVVGLVGAGIVIVGGGGAAVWMSTRHRKTALDNEADTR